MYVIGTIPNKIKEVKTTEELISLFNRTYSLSFTAALHISVLKNFESILKKEVEKLDKEWNMEKPEYMWYILILVYIRFAHKKQDTSHYLIQAIETLISSYESFELEDFALNVSGIYSVAILKNDELNIRVVQNPSKQEEPLPQFGGYIYMALFDNSKKIMNVMNKEILKESVDIENLRSYFPTITIKNKKEIIECIYDICAQTTLNNMTKGGDDIYDFDEITEEEFVEIIQIFHKNIASVINLFVSDVTTIDNCCQKISSIVFTDIANNLE